MNNTQMMMIDMLKTEVRPAMGCTEPVAVVLAVAKARQVLGKEFIDTIEVAVSPNFYKNGLSVGIPQTDQVGLDMAAAIGAAGGNSDKGLEILSTIEAEDVEMAKKYLSQGQVRITIAQTEEKVLVDATVKLHSESARAVIKGHHDRFVCLQRNGETVFKESGQSSEVETVDNPFFDMKIESIIREIEAMPYESLIFLKEGIQMNMEVAKAGMEMPLGMAVGHAVKRQIADGVLEDNLANHAMLLTASASDARMSGITMPVMSSNGSGNNGLTAILPIAAYAQKNEVEDAQLVKALAISHLINCYMKNYIGRLSAICSCAVSAATGSGAAISWLQTGSVKVVEDTIQNMIGNLSGLICDGAKDSCALKLATAAQTGIQMSNMAQYDVVVPARNGIVSSNVERSIRNLGRVSAKGMKVTDGVILEVMKDMADEAINGQNI